MKVAAAVVFVYGLVVLVGGIIGHYKAASTMSLICGLVFGVSMLACTWGVLKGKIAAQATALALIFVLDGFFTYRFAQTGAFFPAGFMSLLSLAALIVLALKVRKAKQKVS